MGLIIVILFMANRANQADAKRWKHNYRAEQTIKARTIIEQTKTIQELRADSVYMNTVIKEVQDSLRVKVKQVEVIHEIKTVEYVTDTVEVHDTVFQGVPMLLAQYDSNCVKVDFMWEDGDSSGIFSVENNIDLFVVDYWKRRDLWGKKFLPKWGKKEYFIDVINRCGNDSIITNRRVAVKK